MDPAVAGILGAATGGVVALAGQYLAHTFAQRRDEATRLAKLVDDATGAMRHALLVADSLLATDNPRARKQALLALYDGSRQVLAASSRLEVHLVDDHRLAAAYAQSAAALGAFLKRCLDAVEGGGGRSP